MDAGTGANQLLQQRLALGQRQRGQVETVEVQQIEDIEHEAVASAFAQIGLQRREVGCPGSRLDHQFAVDKRGFNRQRL